MHVLFFNGIILSHPPGGPNVKFKSPRLRAECDLSFSQTLTLPLQRRSAAGIGQAGLYLVLVHEHLLEMWQSWPFCQPLCPSTATGIWFVFRPLPSRDKRSRVRGGIQRLKLGGDEEKVVRQA